MKKNTSSPRITFSDRGLTLTAQPGESLLDCIRRAGIPIDSTCNGKGICGKCKVQADGALNEVGPDEKKHLAGQPDGVRLACKAKVVGDVRVKLTDGGRPIKSIFGLDDVQVQLDSLVRHQDLVLPDQPGRSHAESLPFRARDPRLLDRIARWSPKKGVASGVTFGDELIDVHPGREHLLGAAVDVGTTSLSLYLFDMESGRRLGKSTALNPQVAYGGDVITRITYCQEDPGALTILQEAVIEGVAKMVDDALGPDRKREQIYFMTVAANTTMIHILAGVAPDSIALSPFTPVFLNPLILEGKPFNLPIHPKGRCLLLPSAGAYIGADIVAGLKAIDHDAGGGITLYADIGTNGEIVLVEGTDRFLATSCAMGPALEGMNISCGCRAVPGAIDTFTLDKDLCPVFTTIENQPPVGICGSGLLDLVAALLDAGLVNSTGAFNRGADPRLVARMKADRYHLTDEVSLSQKDLRQIQLARGAIASAIKLLLAETGRSVDDLDKIIVAGAFGYHLNAASLTRTGFLPSDCRDRISYVGNAALSGAALALLSRQALTDMERIASQFSIMQLGAHPKFKATFLSSLDFDG